MGGSKRGGPKRAIQNERSKTGEKKYFFFGPFCYKNVEKMFYQPQKVIFSPQKVKKVKKVKKNFFFIFHILCKKKSQLYIYFLVLGPLPHL